MIISSLVTVIVIVVEVAVAVVVIVDVSCRLNQEVIVLPLCYL